MINTITFTGADDSVQPKDLLAIIERCPQAEFGILVSEKNWGTPRYPSRNWLHELKWLKDDHPELKLSLHGCGAYVRDLVEGRSVRFFSDLREFLSCFERIQLNTHNIKQGFHADFVRFIQHSTLKDKEWIFQYDETNHKVVEEIARYAEAKCALLFDPSGGRGILADQLPSPIDGIKCGYAGGLGPDSLKVQLERILKTSGETPIWIDMETRIRSDDDRLFDLAKVEICLDIASPYLLNP